MHRLLAALAALSLGACSPQADPAESPTTEAPAPATAAPSQLGGVDLTQPIRVQGTEPFWTLDIADGVATYTDIEDASGDITTPRTGPATPMTRGDAVAYAIALSDGSSLTLILTAGPCADIGEETRALNASLERGGVTQTACADLRTAYPPEVAG